MWKRQPTVRIGTEKVEVKPLNIENGVKLCLLLMPYMARIQAHWPQLLATLESKQPRLLELLLKDLGVEMVFDPGDIAQVFALLLDRDLTWIAQNATTESLFEVLPILDKVNGDLFQTAVKTVEDFGANQWTQK